MQRLIQPISCPVHKFMSNTWENRILWEVYEPETKQGVLGISANQELRELYKTPGSGSRY